MATVIVKMRKLVLFIFLMMALPFMVMFIGCDHKSEAWATMDKAEDSINSHPESALKMLSSIDKNKLGDDEEKARYALLMSMALDKNYIDTTSFEVLQPAIDYYLENGSADNQLRTLYYEGRIFQNKLEFDKAMQCFLKAEDLKNECKDTLTYANLLVAQGNLYAKSYQMTDFVKNNLSAAKLYQGIGYPKRQLSCLIRALDGSIVAGQKNVADSIMSITDTIALNDNIKFKEILSFIKMAYGIKFDSDKEVKAILDSISDISIMDEESKLDIAMGYLKLNDSYNASVIFESIDKNSPIVNSLRYLMIRPSILEANNKYREALEAYKAFQIKVETENKNIYSQKTSVAQDLHELKVNHIYSLQQKDKQIWLGLCTLLVLVIIIGIVCYQLRIGKLKSDVAEKEKKRLQLENDNLQKQNSVLELEKHNAKLECEKQNLAAENMKLKISQLESDKHNADLELDKKNLAAENMKLKISQLESEKQNANLEIEKQTIAAENMRLKISQLESEGEHLKELLAEAKLSKPILDAIKERSDILNGLVAAKISDNDTYSKPYEKWINQITEDRKSFMDSTRLAFKASHPAFMKYLEDHGLTESELNYVCLYAIGLRGKEVGEYIQIKRHYHTSTDIRKKLGLSEDATNLGLHIRNLMKKL